jgi:hypothetical protein
MSRIAMFGLATAVVIVGLVLAIRSSDNAIPAATNKAPQSAVASSDATLRSAGEKPAKELAASRDVIESPLTGEATNPPPAVDVVALCRANEQMVAQIEELEKRKSELEGENHRLREAISSYRMSKLVGNPSFEEIEDSSGTFSRQALQDAIRSFLTDTPVELRDYELAPLAVKVAGYEEAWARLVKNNGLLHQKAAQSDDPETKLAITANDEQRKRVRRDYEEGIVGLLGPDRAVLFRRWQD